VILDTAWYSDMQGKWITKGQTTGTPCITQNVFRAHVFDCHDAEGGKCVFIQVGKLRCSARSYCGRYSEIPYCKYGAVLPHSPNEYRTKRATTGSLEVPSITHTQDLKMAGSEGTRVNRGHSVQTGFMSLDFIVQP
jgi:hypothetical protein